MCSQLDINSTVAPSRRIEKPVITFSILSHSRACIDDFKPNWSFCTHIGLTGLTASWDPATAVEKSMWNNSASDQLYMGD